MAPTQDFKSSVMIALLPTTSYWCNQELPHMTLVYVGEIPDLKPTVENELAKAALSISMSYSTFSLDVLRVDKLGDTAQVEVLLLRPIPELLEMRKLVEGWNASEYPFKAHATIGPVGSSGKIIPPKLTFDRIIVGWGEKILTYNLL